MKEEIWKDIEGYEGLYQVSNLGRVRSLDRYIATRNGHLQFFKSRILATRNDNAGYSYVILCKDSKPKVKKIHRLVAEAFISNPEVKLNVNHIDGNRKNNHVENLEWCTQKENIVHALKTGLMKTGAEHHNAKFTMEQVKQIKKEYQTGEISQSKLAKKYNVSQSAICFIVNNKRHKK